MPNNLAKKDQAIELLSWETIESCVKRIVDWIEETIGNNVAIYGIPRGGMIPAVMVVHQLEARGLRARFTADLNHLMPSELHKLVVIDEMCDSGDTIHVLRQLFPMCKVAVLFERKLDWEGQPLKTDYRCRVIRDSRWLQFPWEAS